MNYTIHQLQLFVRLTETLSITRTAEEMFMTQPAVSIQLKNFQNQFKLPLYEIVGKKVVVTDLGNEILSYARRILNEVDELQFRTKQYEGNLLGKLKISAASTGKYVIPYFLTDFIARHEGIDLILDVTNRSKVLESLKLNISDFAIVSVLPDNMDVEEIELLENKLYLIGNKGSTKESTLIYRENGSATRMEMERFFQQNANYTRKKLELTSNEAVKQAVLAGLGISILPLIGIHNEIENGQLQILKTKGLPIKTKWRLIWLKNRKLTPIMREYINYIRDNNETIRKEHFEWHDNY